MESSEIRQAFFSFFRSKNHHIVPSASLVVRNDPTLMFTNAGMNRFKDIFLGNTPAGHRRIANSQKCLRVSGKHNDMEEVGHDTYHHTMFEMLGNWSFGDYFKKEAVAWAWELLTEVFVIPPDRLYATIFEGSPKEGIERDTETYDYWKNHLPAGHILEGSKKDNFWEMGDAGPCGPCSEIHIDLRNDTERKAIPGKLLVNKDHPLVIEIWNIVFIQFNRKNDGSLELLPQKHVDTGMGFERLCRIIQGRHSNYDTDIFQGIISEIEILCGLTYTRDTEPDKGSTREKINIAMRVIADHLRAVAFSIADGQLPSNTGAGYVIRRILRRALRYYFQSLNAKEPLLYRLVPALVSQMGNAYPELIKQQELIGKVIMEEEQSFLRTLESGITRFNKAVREKKSREQSNIIHGALAFELFDTYGFPVDLTQLMAKEAGCEVDIKEYARCLARQKDRSRQAASLETEDWIVVSENEGHEFVGYDHNVADIEITRYRKVSSKGKDFYQLVFNRTPFYAESGGQAGDTGYIESKGEKIPILDTKKENELTVHFAKELPSYPAAAFRAVVNEEKRSAVACNHTATHLLHEALREVLGSHVEQKGSLVHPDYLRFDFSHFRKMTDEEISKAEALVNQRIRLNLPLEEMRDISMEKAVGTGAIALFGEKYGDRVRVIRFGTSAELCGGIHVKVTGQIGTFRILSEGAVAAGIRRIEAITAAKAEEYISNRLDTLKRIEALFKATPDIVRTVKGLIKTNSELIKQIETAGREKLAETRKELTKKAQLINGITLITELVDVGSHDLLKDMAFQLKNQVDNLCLVTGAVINGKPALTVMISEKLVTEKKLDARQIIREIAKEIGGGGGGQPFYATAGGKDVSGLQRAVNKAKKIIISSL